jgi:hypothetical protein
MTMAAIKTIDLTPTPTEGLRLLDFIAANSSETEDRIWAAGEAARIRREIDRRLGAS